MGMFLWELNNFSAIDFHFEGLITCLFLYESLYEKLSPLDARAYYTPFAWLGLRLTSEWCIDQNFPKFGSHSGVNPKFD